MLGFTDEQKSEMKEIMVGVLEPFTISIQQDFVGLKTELKAGIAEVREEVREVKEVVHEMKENSSELFTKLDKFIKLYDETQQQLAIMSNQMRRLEERITRIEAKTA